MKNLKAFKNILIYEPRFSNGVKKLRLIAVIAFLFIFSLQIAAGILSNNLWAASGRDYDDNAVIYGGALSLGELANYIRTGSDGRHNDIQKIFYTLGIYENEFTTNGYVDGAERQTVDGYVTKSGAVYVNGNPNPVATGVISAGRSYMAGSVADVFGLPIWWRSPSVSFVPNQLAAFVHLVNGRFSYAVIKSCGNPIKVWGSPQISLQKQVRNISRGTDWATRVEAKKGETIEYKITYTVGDESLTNVWIYDTLKGNIAPSNGGAKSYREYLKDPTNLYPSWFHYYPEGITVPTGYRDQRMLVWQAPGRAPRASGTATFRTVIANNIPSGTTILNDSACYADRVGVVFSNPVFVSIPSQPTPSSTYDFVITKTVSLDKSHFSETVSTTPGKNAWYKIYVKNTGSGTLTNLTIKDKLPSKVSFVSGSAYLYPQGVKISDRLVSSGVNVGNLASNQSCYLIFQVKLDSYFSLGTTALKNVVSAKDDHTSWKEDTANINVGYYIAQLVQAKSAINVTQGGVDATTVMARPGDVIRYTLTTQNTGNAVEPSYAVRDDISDLFKYANVTNTGGGTVQGNDIVYPARDINPGQTITNNFEVTIKPSAEWSGTSLVMTNTYGNEVPVPVGDIIKWKTAYNETQGVDATTTQAKPGDVIRYTLYVQNKGALAEEDYIIEDDLSDVLEYAEIKELGGATLTASGIIRWSAIDIPSDQTVFRSFRVSVKPDSTWPRGGDMIMTNVYGNKIDVPVIPPTPGVLPAVAGAVKGLATTGTVLNIIFGTFILLSSIYLYFRQRILLRLALLDIK